MSSWQKNIDSAKRGGKVASASVLNQALSSGTNFLIGIFLAIELTTSQFGVYGICFAVVLFFSGLSNALLTLQMVVWLPHRVAEERRQFAAEILVLLAIASTAPALLAGALLLALTATGWLDSHMPGYMLAIAVASAGASLKDFVVRLSYSERSEWRAVEVSSVVAIITALGFVIVKSSGVLSSTGGASTAIWVVAAGYLAGSFVGLLRANLPITDVSAKSLRDVWATAWTEGRWASAGALVAWLQSQVYVYATAILVGPAGVGVANTARLFVAPFQFLSAAISQVVLPRLATVAARGGQLRAAAKRYVTLMSCLASLYLAALYVLYPRLDKASLSTEYANLGVYVAAWAAVLLVQILREGASAPLQALRSFQFIWSRNWVSALVALSTAVPFSIYFGATGAIASLAIGEATFAVLLWMGLRNKAEQSLVKGTI